MILPITLTMAAACALLNIWLAVRIMRLRVGRKVPIGDAGDPLIFARMRAQANFTEYAPFFLILTGLIESAIGSAVWLWALGILFIAGRIAHAFGMDSGGVNQARRFGAIATWLLLLGYAIYALLLVYRGMTPPLPAAH
jgi:uncharacterized membrane protein YecN with MAPEG domain